MIRITQFISAFTAAAVVATALPPAAPASADEEKIADRFNNKRRDKTIWNEDIDIIGVRELEGKLQTRSGSEGPGVRWSGYRGNGWFLDPLHKWTLSGTFELTKAERITQDRYAGAGFSLLYPNSSVEVRIETRLTPEGYFIVVELYRNDRLRKFERQRIPMEKSTVNVIYLPRKDRLLVRVNGQRAIVIRRWLRCDRALDRPIEVGFGAVRFGYPRWRFFENTLDNFRARGEIIRDEKDDEFDPGGPGSG